MTENGDGIHWKVSKDQLIREITSTYEAIQKFKEYQVKGSAELEKLSMDDLYKELQTQTDLLDKLVSDWDIQK